MTAPPTARFLVLYTAPTDPGAFDEHYREVHLPIAKRLPGLRRYTLSRHVTTVRGDSKYHLVAQLEWNHMDALRVAFASQEGQAAAADMANLGALCTVHSVTYEVHDVG